MATRLLSKVEAESNRFAALATYRHLLRATWIAFKGDSETLTASRAFARDSFHQNARLESGGVEASLAVEHAQGVTKILKEHVVQGKNVGEDKYKLNIHEHTQKLDNDTAGQLKGTSKTFKEVKNATF